jgi:hypothetical protein
MKGCGHSVDDEGHLLLNHRVGHQVIVIDDQYAACVEIGELVEQCKVVFPHSASALSGVSLRTFPADSPCTNQARPMSLSLSAGTYSLVAGRTDGSRPCVSPLTAFAHPLPCATRRCLHAGASRRLNSQSPSVEPIYALAGPALYIMAIHPGETDSWVMTSPDPSIQHGDNRQHGGQMKPTRYRICVHGQLTDRLGSTFDGMSGVWRRKSR